ncbi:DUF4244 domain-containing protein [Streptomyces californicus]|uniref:DUF4244 domain-containing protein n=1 Tax=Streptomyces TaxID=1883 RepID=UPI0015C49778|nr:MULTISPECIES: DUF4244 domain-containing protein [Streptomyces]MDW4897757.1 DUF4244 domain-containing protein [Streptomyces californicus]QLG32890.1 DUF4244 domain-containing protein [Streptomyces sp. CB04723]
MESTFWGLRSVKARRCARPSEGASGRSEKWSTWWAGRLRRPDRGMTTSEYAVGTIAACAFAAVLYKVVNSGPVLSALQSLVEDALDAKF